MKKIVLLLLLALAPAAFAQAAKEKAKAPATGAAKSETLGDRIRGVWKAWSAMDAKAAGAYYAKDPDAVFFDVTPLKYSGWGEYEKGVQAVFKAYKTISLKPNSDLKVHESGDWAWVTSTLTGEFTTAAGKQDSAQVRWTSVWQKRNGAWLIVHEHVSEPLASAT